MEYKQEALKKRSNLWSKYNSKTGPLPEFAKKNKHILQYLVANDKIPPNTELSSFFKGNEKRKEYKRRNNEIKTVEHWGQRKLLIAEIQFLLICGDLSDKVVYAGAANGDHIPFLSKLFPNHEFYLYDPNKFNIEDTDKIHIFRDYFTDKIAETYKNVLFISDIRTTIKGDVCNQSCDNDMKMQKRWCEIMKPLAASLKFRLPYNKNIDISYLDGDLYFPVWGPATTTECRLFVTDFKKPKIYNSRAFEEIMFYFNTETRVYYYKHDADFCHCFDCASEVYWLKKYIGKNSKLTVTDLSKIISEEISNYRTL